MALKADEVCYGLESRADVEDDEEAVAAQVLPGRYYDRNMRSLLEHGGGFCLGVNAEEAR